MADEDDLRDLKAGDRDMARRDFRHADLSNLDLSERDFTGSLLQSCNCRSANLARAILTQASTSKWNAEAANLQSAVAATTVFYAVNFERADLRHAQLRRCHFPKSNLSNSNLVGADFRDAVFDENTTFEGALTDETTLFDGASIYRATAKQAAFRYYKVESGKLVRLSVQATASKIVQNGHLPFDRDAVALVDEISATLSQLQTKQALGMLGHNGPPDALPLEPEEQNDLADALRRIRGEALGTDPNLEIAQDAMTSVQGAATKIALWVAAKVELASDEFAKQFGKSLGSGKVWLGGWLMLSGQLESLATLISQWLR